MIPMSARAGHRETGFRRLARWALAVLVAAVSLYFGYAGIWGRSFVSALLSALSGTRPAPIPLAIKLAFLLFGAASLAFVLALLLKRPWTWRAYAAWFLAGMLAMLSLGVDSPPDVAAAFLGLAPWVGHAAFVGALLFWLSPPRRPAGR